MVKIYYKLIKAGLITIDDIPTVWRDAVQTLYEVNKTTYTADATFNKIGVVDDGTTLGTDTEENEVGEVLKEEADINAEVTAGN